MTCGDELELDVSMTFGYMLPHMLNSRKGKKHKRYEDEN
jgi:hypothetical protein